MRAAPYIASVPTIRLHGGWREAPSSSQSPVSKRRAATSAHTAYALVGKSTAPFVRAAPRRKAPTDHRQGSARGSSHTQLAVREETARQALLFKASQRFDAAVGYSIEGSLVERPAFGIDRSNRSATLTVTAENQRLRQTQQEKIGRAGSFSRHQPGKRERALKLAIARDGLLHKVD